MNLKDIPVVIIEQALDKLPELYTTQNEYISIAVSKEFNVAKKIVTKAMKMEKYTCIFKKNHEKKAWELISIDTSKSF